MWFIISLLLVAGASAQIVSQAGDKCSHYYVCPPQYLRLNQNCYFFSKNKTTWQEAFFTCQDLDGKFAIIKNAHQDRMLGNFLNKISLVSEERWIGGMYDWEQMSWKWGASGKEIMYRGFSRRDSDDKEQLKWHCTVLDPTVQYKWNSRSCLEEKYFICQTKLRKSSGKQRKKLQRQYDIAKYNKLNEVPIPDITDHERNSSFLTEPKPSVIMYQDSAFGDDNAFANRNMSIVEKVDERRARRKQWRKKIYGPQIINGTEYIAPQLKYGKRLRRRNKSKESKEDADGPIENMHTQISYGAIPDSPLHPRIITEELSFP